MDTKLYQSVLYHNIKKNLKNSKLYSIITWSMCVNVRGKCNSNKMKQKPIHISGLLWHSFQTCPNDQKHPHTAPLPAIHRVFRNLPMSTLFPTQRKAVSFLR